MTMERDDPTVYTVVLTAGDDGWVGAQIAEVPEAISQGRTREEARANVAEALDAALEWRRAEGEDIPSRAKVVVERLKLRS